MISRKELQALLTHYAAQNPNQKRTPPIIEALNTLLRNTTADNADVTEKFVNHIYDLGVTRAFQKSLNHHLITLFNKPLQESDKSRAVTFATTCLFLADENELLSIAGESHAIAEIILRNATLLEKVTYAEPASPQEVPLFDLFVEATNTPTLTAPIANGRLTSKDIEACLSQNKTLLAQHQFNQSLAASSPPTPQTQSLFPPASTPASELVWENVLVALLNCVRRDEHGAIIGIDTELRKRTLRQECLVETNQGPRFREFTPKHNAGNIVFTKTKRTVNTGYPHERLGEIDVVLNQRYDTAGRPLGRSLYGGLASKADGGRAEAAITNTSEKIKLAATSESKKQRVLQQLNALNHTKSTLAYSVHDTGYLVNTFMPTRDFLNRLHLQNKISADHYNFYNELLNHHESRMGHLLKDPSTLKVATSNTYHIELNTPDGQRLLEELSNTALSEPYKFVRYQLESRPLLDALFPQDYTYRHEFYAGLLAVTAKKLNDSVHFIQCIEAANSKIIERMRNDIQQGNLPAVIQGLNPQQAYLAWKANVEINFHEFMRNNPGFDKDTLYPMYGIEQDTNALSSIDIIMQDTWAAQKNAIISELESRLQRPGFQFKEDTIFGLAQRFSATNTPTDNIARIDELRQGFIDALITSSIVADHFVTPIIAVDAQIYSKDTEYHQIRPFKSPFTRVDFTGQPYFEFSRLKNFIDAVNDIPQRNYLTALYGLSTDMLTGQLMQNPKLAIVKVGQAKKALLCDESTLNQLPGVYDQSRGGHRVTIEIETSKAYDELRNLIDLEKDRLAQLNTQRPTPIPPAELARRLVNDNIHSISAAVSVTPPPVAPPAQPYYGGYGYRNYIPAPQAPERPRTYTVPTLSYNTQR